ncbi:hypothetical protein Lal_00018482 [Lupinus albus]|nr:hypothetical protein Lal_00018482 [Lupinus albus]
MTEYGFVFPEFFKNHGLQVFVELHGKIYPSLIREFYSNFQHKNGIYQTMVKDKFIVLDEDLLVDVVGLDRFDHQYGYFEEKLLNSFEPAKVYKSMLRDSQQDKATNRPQASALAVEYRLLHTLLENLRIDWPELMLLNMLEFSKSSGALGYQILISRIIEHALVDLSDIGYLITDPQEHLILGQYIHFHLDIYKYDGIWTCIEDVDFYPIITDLLPLMDDSDEDTVAHPVHYQALDEVEDVEDDPEEDLDDE